MNIDVTFHLVHLLWPACSKHVGLLVGGIALWLRCQSLAGSDFPCPVLNLCLTGDTLWVNSPPWVSKLGQLSLPFSRDR